MNLDATPDVSSLQIIADSSIATPTVSESRWFWIAVIWSPTSPNTAAFYGCKVNYQSNTVD